MPHNYVKKKGTGDLAYTQDDMADALMDLGNGESGRAVAKRYGILKTTLHKLFHSQVQLGRPIYNLLKAKLILLNKIMNQVDNIIFQNFLSLGWEKEDASSLQDLEVSEIAKLMVKCLYAVNPECDLPHSLPHNMSQRFRVAASIAESIKDLGYRGDLGYQSILYSNEADLRKIFTFLIEKLPKDAPTLTREPLGKSALIQREMCRKLSKTLQRPWLPPHCLVVGRKYKAAESDDVSITTYGTSHCHPFASSRHRCLRINSQSFSDYQKDEDNSKPVFHLFELPPKQILPTLLQSHAERLGKTLSSRDEFVADSYKAPELNETLSSTSKYKGIKRKDLCDVFEENRQVSTRNKEILEEQESLNNTTLVQSESSTSSNQEAADVGQLLKAMEEDNEKKLSALSLQISQLQEDVYELVRSCNEKEESINSLKEIADEGAKKLAEEEKKLVLLRKTASLASDPGGSIEKLKSSLEASKEREEKLLKQWIEFKLPLEKELNEAKLKLDKNKSKWSKIEDEISELKKTTQSLAEEARRKESLLVQLKEQKNKLNKGTNRAVYTKQILDVSAKVQKQKQEIDKILSETRPIQKEINNLTGKLQRTFAVVEDASFKAASVNERARPIYRSVIAIHEEFGSIVDIVRDTGCIQREIADLQQQLNSEKSKNIEDNLKKLEDDFKNLRAENSSLKQKLNC